jgi:TctA family transporter
MNQINMKKRTFDIIFIFVTAIILIALSKFEILEKYVAFSLIPILIAYQLGQYSERKFKNE